MNAELLYTSAPQGLKQGSRGFCTVLSTAGMPLNIATKLESLSGYRHLYPSGTPDATKNPISYSHLKLSVGGRTISVISRIADYGLDYSQRTNKIAHHIVVDAPGPTCGPAALLADPTVMRTQWDGNCVNVPTPPALPNTAVKPNPCSYWAAITGDAGWGGVLANAWLTPSSKPIFVVFSEDQSVQLLALIQESIALLPPAKRWQATFGTYVTNLPPDVECKVRCVVAGSEEARMASARGIVINLTQVIGSAPQSEAVSAARNGTTIGAQTSGPPSQTSVDRDEKHVETQSDETQQADVSHEHIEEASTVDFDPDNPFANATPDLPPSMRTKPTGELRMPIHSHATRNLIQSITGTAIIAAFLLVSSFIGVAYYLSENSFLRGLDLGDKNSPNSYPEGLEREGDTIENTKPPKSEIPLSRADVLSSSDEMETQQNTPQPRSAPLGHHEIEIELAHEKYLFRKPVAIRGQSVKAIVKGSKQSLTDEEKKYLNEIIDNAVYEWKAVDSQSNPVTLKGSSDKTITPSINSDAHELSLTISYKDEYWTAGPIRVLDAAKASDFNLNVNDFIINEKTIPFGVPGAEIIAHVDIINQQEDRREYLTFLNRDATITWHDDSGREISKGPQYQVKLDNKYNSINAVVLLGDNEIKVHSESKPIIAMLEGRIHFNMNGDKSNSLEVHIQEPVALVKPFQVRLGRRRLKDSFSVDHLISENDMSTGARSLKELQDFVDQTTTLALKLKGDYSQLETLARDSKGVDVNKDLVSTLECLGDRSPREIEIALSQKKFDDLEKIVDLLNQLVSIAGTIGIDYKAEIAKRCKPSDPTDQKEVGICRERERRELRFVEWLKGGELTNIAKSVVVEQLKKLRDNLHEIRQSILKLTVDVEIVLPNVKPKLEILSLTDIEKDPVKLGEFSIPIRLLMNNTSNRKQDPGGNTSSVPPSSPASNVKIID